MEEYFLLSVRRRKIERAYLELWREHRLDAIIMLPAPYTAVPIDSWSSANYTAIWNLLDYPAAVIPVGKVVSMDLVDDPSNAKYGDTDYKIYQKCKKIFLSMMIAILISS